MDLLLEHQNGEFKRFQADCGSSLQESNYLFKLHALTADPLQKARRAMNKIVIGRQRKSCHPEKNTSFDILSLADQLHRSKSTDLQGPEQGNIYFSENQVPNLISEGAMVLPDVVKTYNESVAINAFGGEIVDSTGKENEGEEEWIGIDEEVNELFNNAKDTKVVISDLLELYL